MSLPTEFSGLQVVVEERERLFSGERPKPERHLRQLNSEWIQIHTVDAPLGDLPARPVDVVVLLTVSIPCWAACRS